MPGNWDTLDKVRIQGASIRELEINDLVIAPAVSIKFHHIIPLDPLGAKGTVHYHTVLVNFKTYTTSIPRNPYRQCNTYSGSYMDHHATMGHQDQQ
jgi:hypothetical protein